MFSRKRFALFVVLVVGVAAVAVGHHRFDAPMEVEQQDGSDSRDPRANGYRAARARPALPPTAGERAADILAPLEKALFLSQEQQDKLETAVYFELLHRLRAEPDSVGDLRDLLMTASRDQNEMRLAVAALVAAGHEQAQSLLAETVRARQGDGDFIDAVLPVASMVAQPTSELENAIRDLAINSEDEDVRSAATLGLGIVGNRLTGSSPARAEKIVADLLAELDRDLERGALGPSLSALGNVGTAKVVPIAAELASSDNPIARRRAVDSVRFVDTPEAETLVLDALQTDTDAQVRHTAAQGLSRRSPNESLVRAQIMVLMTDTSADVAATLLNTLYAARQAFPDKVRRALQDAASSHHSEDIRRRAQELLARWS